ncbi:MAG: hypothetical protein WC749_13950, partial [Dehalococcoidia bacterium]
MQLSDDSCSIGFCKWLGNKCVTDANDDDISDRGLHFPPITNVTFPQRLLKLGDNISFKVKVTKNEPFVILTPVTYYCISENICCPTTKVSGGSFVLNSLNHSNVGQGLRKLFYYSTYEQNDFKDMREAVKNVSLYIDLQPPGISWFNYTLESSAIFTNTDLTINFNTDESAQCTGNLVEVGKAITLTKKTPTKFTVKYTNLSDANYHYVISCTDYSGNSMKETKLIIIDRINLIVDIRPEYETLKNSVTLRVRTEGATTCYASMLQPDRTTTLMNGFQDGIYYTFTKPNANHNILGAFMRGSFLYKVDCFKDALKDSISTAFTIDDVAPRSWIALTPPGAAPEPINYTRWYTNESVFTIFCQDENIGPQNDPPVFGCNITKWCSPIKLGDSCDPSSTGLTISKLPNSKTYCYKSIDRGGNIEMAHCDTLNIDSVPPSKPTITTSRYANKELNLINVSLVAIDHGNSATDEGSGIQLYIYRLINSSNSTFIGWTPSQVVDGSYFPINIAPFNLSEGRVFYLEARAIDNANLLGEIARSQGIVITCSRGLQYTICAGDTCSCNRCGDDNIDAGEECDEGSDNSDTGECTTLCKNARCGDGLLWNYQFKDGLFKGTEECDDINNITGDGCNSTCRWERCGNANKEPSEGCDNGNSTDTTGSCINCYRARCGDGFLYAGHEQCDPKDSKTKSGCSKNCTKAETPSDTCKNGLRDNDETDIDCGGSCTAKCLSDKRCIENADCVSDLCKIMVSSQAGICTDDKCANNKLDIGEADMDCGTNCPAKCKVGSNCRLGTDCESKICKSNKCAAPSCDDAAMNGVESDIDCGGSCSKCDDGKRCLASGDCKSGLCTSGYCEQEKDTDHDGMDDEWEARYCKDTNDHCDPNADPDKDGLTNLDEFRYGTDPTEKDTDGDGYSDGVEVDKGTDPLDPESHPEGGFPWWIFILLILILIIVGVYLALKKSKETGPSRKEPREPLPARQAIMMTPPLRPPATMQAQRGALQPRKPIFADHSDLFTPFEDKSRPTRPAGPEPKSSAKDMEEGFEMPGWMKDKGGVWRRLEAMNKEELGRMGKVATDVHSDLSAMYGKRLDKNLKDSLSQWVLTGMISRGNLKDIISALSKEGKLNKAVMRYILSDMLDEKKISKTELTAMLRSLSKDGLLSEGDSMEFINYLKE